MLLSPIILAVSSLASLASAAVSKTASMKCSSIPDDLKPATLWTVTTQQGGPSNILFQKDQCQNQTVLSEFKTTLPTAIIEKYDFSANAMWLFAIRENETSFRNATTMEHSVIIGLLSRVRDETLQSLKSDPEGSDFSLFPLNFKRSWKISSGAVCVNGIKARVYPIERNTSGGVRRYCIPFESIKGGDDSAFNTSMFSELPAQIMDRTCLSLNIFYEMSIAKAQIHCARCVNPYVLRSDRLACKPLDSVNETTAPSVNRVCQWDNDQTFLIFPNYLGEDRVSRFQPGINMERPKADENGCVRNTTAFNGTQVALSFLRSADPDVVPLCLVPQKNETLGETLGAAPCKEFEAQIYFTLDANMSFSVGQSTFKIINQKGPRLVDSSTNNGGFVSTGRNFYFDPQHEVDQGTAFMLLVKK